jgi:hypothetical protein
MARKRDTLERRNRRFLLPILNFTAPAFLALFIGAEAPALVCGTLSRLAPAGNCSFSFPPIFIYTFAAMALLGLCGSAWRFYKDYICHERFDGLF